MMIIAPDDGRIPWWRLLWSLLGALLITMVGVIVLMTDLGGLSPAHAAVELVAVPFVRVVYYLLGFKGDTAILVSAVGSFLFWWCTLFVLMVRHMRKHARPA